MPSLSTYKKIVGAHTNGEQRKIQSDQIMDATWDEDIATRTCYFYDWYHDNHKTQLNDLHPEKDRDKIPMRVKYITHTSQTFDKDDITYHLQMRPSQEEVVPYYQEMFGRYHANYPCGLYVDIPDNKGRYNRWLVVTEANFNDTQFSTFEIIRCDKVIQYIMNGKKMNVPGCLRSQNSYNSGLWTDYKFTTVEDQQKFILPLNDETELIYYTDSGVSKNLRFIIDSPLYQTVDPDRMAEPRAWKVSKVNRLAYNGLTLITCAQDKFDQHHDVIEYNEDRSVVIGMWADYYTESVEPEPIWKPIVSSHIYSKITYNGVKPEIKVGGTPKKLTITFYDENEVIEHSIGEWSFYIDDTDISNFIQWNIISDNQISVGIKDIDAEYIGKVVRITNTTTDNIVSYVDMEIAYL